MPWHLVDQDAAYRKSVKRSGPERSNPFPNSNEALGSAGRPLKKLEANGGKEAATVWLSSHGPSAVYEKIGAGDQ
jgi:hypothetical protein